MTFIMTLDLDPDNFEAFFSKVLLLYKMEKFDEALESIEKAIDLQPERPEVWYYKGIILEKLERHEEALEVLEANFLINKDTQSLTIKANILLKLKRLSEALEALEEILKRDPWNISALNVKCSILDDLERYDEAIQYYDKALAVDPTNVNALNGKGRALNNQGKYEEAIKYYDKALAVDPNYTLAQENKKLALKRLSEEVFKRLSEEKTLPKDTIKMVSDYLAVVNGAIADQMILSSRERLSLIIDKEPKPYKFQTSIKKRVLYGVLQNLGFTSYVQNKRTDNMLQEILREVYNEIDEAKVVIIQEFNKIDEAKVVIIQELTSELLINRVIELTGTVSRLIRNVGHFYDSPTYNKIESLLNGVNNLIGRLVTEMNYLVDKPKSVFHVFKLYVLCICLYSLIQFEYISRYVDNDDQTSAIIKRVRGEINQAYSKYDYIYDKAYKLIESRFSELTVEKIEPWHNMLTRGGTMIYKINYKFDNNTIKAIDLKIKQTSKSDYNKDPRPDAIIKIRGDNYYYLWPPSVNEKTLYTDAFNQRKKHIEDIFNQKYKEFISNKGNFVKQIEFHSKIFTNII